MRLIDTERAFAAVAIIYMLMCLVLGGATRDNDVILAVIELAGLPTASWAWARMPRPRPLGLLLLIGFAMTLPLVQLIPLPPPLWRSLPGHRAVALTLSDAGVREHWRAMTLAPASTTAAFLSLIPAIAVCLSVLAMDDRTRLRLSTVITGFAACSILLGLAQLAGGPESPLRLYQTTNIMAATGFFANRNHQAALLVVAMPLAALVLGYHGRRPATPRAAVTGALACCFLFGAAAIASRSRAAILLVPAALTASLWLLPVSRRCRCLVLGTALVGGVVWAFHGGILAEEIMARFSPTHAELRATVYRIIFGAAGQYAPLGSGLGSFDAVYRAAEPDRLLSPSFLNHAHNDYLELWLEGGAPALVGVILGVIWWLVMAFRVAGEKGRRTRTRIRQTGVAVTGLLIAHSFVDYPLRTAALSCVFGMAAALCVSPGDGGDRTDPDVDDR
jgi:O-antigen ligase